MTYEALVQAAVRATQTRLGDLRDLILGRLAAIVRVDPTVAEPGQKGPGHFELSHRHRVVNLAQLAIAQWTDQWEVDLETAIHRAAQAGQDSPMQAVVHAVHAGALREALASDDAQLLRALGIEVDDVAEQTAAQIVDQFTVHLVDTLSAEAQVAVSKILYAGIRGGASPAELMQQLTRVLTGTGEENRGPLQGRVTPNIAVRAETIVRTELARAFNTATHLRQQQLGDAVEGLRKRWVAVLDARTRPEHRQAHEETLARPIPIGDDFEVGDELLRFPGDPDGSPDNTINCRCRVVTVVSGAAALVPA